MFLTEQEMSREYGLAINPRRTPQEVTTQRMENLSSLINQMESDERGYYFNVPILTTADTFKNEWLNPFFNIGGCHGYNLSRSNLSTLPQAVIEGQQEPSETVQAHMISNELNIRIAMAADLASYYLRRKLLQNDVDGLMNQLIKGYFAGIADISNQYQSTYMLEFFSNNYISRYVMPDVALELRKIQTKIYQSVGSRFHGVMQQLIGRFRDSGEVDDHTGRPIPHPLRHAIENFARVDQAWEAFQRHQDFEKVYINFDSNQIIQCTSNSSFSSCYDISGRTGGAGMYRNSALFMAANIDVMLLAKYSSNGDIETRRFMYYDDNTRQLYVGKMYGAGLENRYMPFVKQLFIDAGMLDETSVISRGDTHSYSSVNNLGDDRRIYQDFIANSVNGYVIGDTSEHNRYTLHNFYARSINWKAHVPYLPLQRITYSRHADIVVCDECGYAVGQHSPYCSHSPLRIVTADDVNEVVDNVIEDIVVSTVEDTGGQMRLADVVDAVPLVDLTHEARLRVMRSRIRNMRFSEEDLTFQVQMNDSEEWHAISFDLVEELTTHE